MAPMPSGTIVSLVVICSCDISPSSCAWTNQKKHLQWVWIENTPSFCFIPYHAMLILLRPKRNGCRLQREVATQIRPFQAGGRKKLGSWSVFNHRITATCVEPSNQNTTITYSIHFRPIPRHARGDFGYSTSPEGNSLFMIWKSMQKMLLLFLAGPFRKFKPFVICLSLRTGRM